MEGGEYFIESQISNKWVYWDVPAYPMILGDAKDRIKILRNSYDTKFRIVRIWKEVIEET